MFRTGRARYESNAYLKDIVSYDTIHKMQPTSELYDFFTRAYQHFNRHLFDSALAPCMLTIQRQKGCMGLFYPERWVTDGGARCHELALNPTYFGTSRLVEVFQTLVHEQCHMWQQEYGRPSRSGYHNREWAQRMESIGLMPSSTGEPGGRRTGQCMSDYALPDGLFLAAARKFIEGGGRLKWLDRFRVPDRPRPDSPLLPLGEEAGEVLLTPVASLFDDVQGEDFEAPRPSVDRNKLKYTCPGCGCNVWGKPGLRIRCEPCDLGLHSEAWSRP